MLSRVNGLPTETWLYVTRSLACRECMLLTQTSRALRSKMRASVCWVGTLPTLPGGALLPQRVSVFVPGPRTHVNPLHVPVPRMLTVRPSSWRDASSWWYSLVHAPELHRRPGGLSRAAVTSYRKICGNLVALRHELLAHGYHLQRVFDVVRFDQPAVGLPPDVRSKITYGWHKLQMTVLHSKSVLHLEAVARSRAVVRHMEWCVEYLQFFQHLELFSTVIGTDDAARTIKRITRRFVYIHTNLTRLARLLA